MSRCQVQIMADDVSKAEAMPEAAQAPMANEAASLAQQTQPAAPPGTPHKDVVMPDAPVEQAAVPLCPFPDQLATPR